jgi:hypothetical protein
MALGKKCSWRNTSRGKEYFCTLGPNRTKANALKHSPLCAEHKHKEAKTKAKCKVKRAAKEQADPALLAARRAADAKRIGEWRKRTKKAAPGALGKLQKLTPAQRAAFRDDQTGGADDKKEAEAFKLLAKLLTRRGLFYV